MKLKQNVMEKIERFISGDDVSVIFANKIGALLDEQYPEDDYIQDVVFMLACYSPEGGDNLHDLEVVTKKLTLLKSFLLSDNSHYGK